MDFFVILVSFFVLFSCSKGKYIPKNLDVIDLDQIDKEFENANKDLN